MPKRTVYVRDEDQAVWDQAEALAGQDSLSSFVAEALRRLIEVKETAARGFAEVELPVRYALDEAFPEVIDMRPVSFRGRVIAQHVGGNGTIQWTVYLTPKGNLLFYQISGVDGKDGATYEVFKSLQEAERAVWPDEPARKYPLELLRKVSEGNGENWPVHLDI